MRIIGIETSCDETGIAIYDDKLGLLSHQLYSQVTLHTKYGGVVPELASRNHIKKTIPLIQQAMCETSLTAKDIDAIAYTAGPGLAGALLVGATIARSIAYAWNIPAIAVHHLEGHLLAPMLEDNPPQFPFIALLVSGGHTMIVKVAAIGDYQILGESVDDAAGEAFDKTAKLLDLGYPGGAKLSQLAAKGEINKFKFPRPMTDRPGLDMSFSGLKTFAANTIYSHLNNINDPHYEQTKADIALAFEDAVCATLTIKCKRAIYQTGIKRIVIAGGVSANHRLRTQLTKLMDEINGEIFYPRLEFCTDNGAMIAYAGMQRFKASVTHDLAIEVKPRWPIDTLTTI